MKVAKLSKLQKRGWKVGSTAEFLGLSPEESFYIEMKIALSQSLRQRRKNGNLSQVQLAELVNTSQSRVAKMEACDPTVSMDLLIKTLLALGASPADLAKTIA